MGRLSSAVTPTYPGRITGEQPNADPRSSSGARVCDGGALGVSTQPMPIPTRAKAAMPTVSTTLLLGGRCGAARRLAVSLVGWPLR